MRRRRDDAYLHALEMYRLAVGELVGAREVRLRLAMAYRAILPLAAHQMPDHLRDKHRELKEALTWLPVEEPGEPAVVATLREMADEEADRLAKVFFEIYLDVNRASHALKQP